MKNEVIEFIERRFPINDNWCNGNCYFFALILSDVFDGTIFYDMIEGHFITQIQGKLYDWHGEYKCQNECGLINWNEIDKFDSLLKERIIRDCIK